eukprot:42969-Eustigmatos_ZCMA.PRE.1
MGPMRGWTKMCNCNRPIDAQAVVHLDARVMWRKQASLYGLRTQLEPVMVGRWEAESGEECWAKL